MQKILFGFMFVFNFFGEVLAEEVQNSFGLIKGHFMQASKSVNRLHIADALLKTLDVENAKIAAEKMLKSKMAEPANKILPENEKTALSEECKKKAIDLEVEHAIARYSNLLDYFAKNRTKSVQSASRIALPEYVLSDLKISVGSYNSELSTVVSRVFRGQLQTLSGLACATDQLYNPCSTIKSIEAKQKCVKWLIENPAKAEQLKDILQQIAIVEKELFDQPSASSEKINPKDWTANFAKPDSFFLTKQLEKIYNIDLNIQRSILMNSFDAPTILLNFFAFIIAPMMVKGSEPSEKFVAFQATIFSCLFKEDVATIKEEVRNVNKLSLIISDHLLTLFRYYVTIKNLYSVCLAVPKIFNALLNTQKYLIKMQQLQTLSKKLEILLPQEIFAEINLIKKCYDPKKDSEFQALLQRLNKKTFADKASFLSYHGRIINAFKMFEAQKNKFCNVFEAAGMLDCYLASASLLSQELVGGNGFCFVNFLNKKSIEFDCEGMWNVLLDQSKAISNDLKLGEIIGDQTIGALLSGPNFGGKSIYLRGIITAALLAQSFGIAPVKKLSMTLFDCFSTYIDIQDDPSSGESNFSAECLRMEEFATLVEAAAKKGQKVFIAADELLRGTKPEYSEATIRSLLAYIANFDNVMILVSSHYSNVIKNIVKDTHGKIKQIFVGSKVDARGFYESSTNKIHDGVSPVDSAFKIMQNKFSTGHAKIVEDAKKIWEESHVSTVA